MKGIILFFITLNAFASAELVQRVYDSLNPANEIILQVSLGKMTKAEMLTELNLDPKNFKNNGDKKFIREFGGPIILENNQIKVDNLFEGSSSSLAMEFSIKKNQKVIGEFHTHPYKYESLKNMPFSPRDFHNLYNYSNASHLVKDYISFIIAGDHSYAMVVEDPERALEFWKGEDRKAIEAGYEYTFDYLYKKYYSRNSGDEIIDIQINSLIYIMKGSGIKLYRIKNYQIEKLN